METRESILPADSPASPLLGGTAGPQLRSTQHVLEIEGLEQRLFDPQRREEFIVYVRERISIPERSLVAILGPSGCGKTTLLSVLGLLRCPSHPERLRRFSIWAGGHAGALVEHDLKTIWMKRRRMQVERLRRSAIGFALQSGELLPALTVRENVAAPLHLNGISGQPCWQRVNELLSAFGLVREGDGHAGDGKLAYSRVNKLSGGEYQRVALARAIAHQPTLVFVDEPTAALNRELARGALQQLRTLQLRETSHGAIFMITHDEQLAEEFASHVIRMAPMRGRPAGEVVEFAARALNVHLPDNQEGRVPASHTPNGEES